MHIRGLSLLVAVAAGLPVPAQHILTVDALGGGNYLDIASAVAAAQPGDIIRVVPHPTPYMLPSSITKPLALVTAGPGRAYAYSIQATLSSLPAGTRFSMVGFGLIDFSLSSLTVFSVAACQGTVHFEDVLFSSGNLGLSISFSSHVTIDHCRIDNGMAIANTAMTVISSTYIRGKDSAPAVFGTPAVESTGGGVLAVANPDLVGGNEPGHNGPFYGGGHGIRKSGGALYLTGSVAALGGGILPGFSAGPPAYSIDAPGILILHDPAGLPNLTFSPLSLANPIPLGFVFTNIAMLGTNFYIDLYHRPNTIVALYLALALPEVPTGGWFNYMFAPPQWSVMIALGMVPAQGPLTTILGIPPVPELGGLPLALQGFDASLNWSLPATTVLRF